MDVARFENKNCEIVIERVYVSVKAVQNGDIAGALTHHFPSAEYR
jgi:ribosomal protein S17E